MTKITTSAASASSSVLLLLLLILPRCSHCLHRREKEQEQRKEQFIPRPNSSTKPNIILIFVDDWAWNGMSVLMDDTKSNSGMAVVEMPNLEGLAEEGIKFRNAYAGAPVCSPSRNSLQTGKSAPRTGFTGNESKNPGSQYYDFREKYRYLPLIPTVSNASIAPTDLSIAQVLNPLGYRCAHFGKWHMGGGGPGSVGYEEHDGDTNNGPGNTIGTTEPIPESMRDPKLMSSVTDRAIGFMERLTVQQEEDQEERQPFYLQISHYAVHSIAESLYTSRTKYANKPQIRDYYAKSGYNPTTIRRNQDPAVWLGMVDDLDFQIGRILTTLEKLDIADNTYVVVTSDNGNRHNFIGTNRTQPLHAGKWWLWEGGLRVPMIIRGPNIPRGRVFHHNVVQYDLLPTFYDWAGGLHPREHLKDIDGISLAPFLRAANFDSNDNEDNQEDHPSSMKTMKEEFKSRYLYFHYPHYRRSMPHSAIVSGSYKLIHFYEKPHLPMLFDLSKSYGEVMNIARFNMTQHQTLYNELMRYLDEVGARYPAKNPEYDPDVYRNAKEYKVRIEWGPFELTRELEKDEISDSLRNTLSNIFENQSPSRTNGGIVDLDQLYEIGNSFSGIDEESSFQVETMVKLKSDFGI